MDKKTEFWMAHIAAIKREGISTSAYAKRHALAVKSLYRWQRKLKCATIVPASASHGGAFVALQVAAPEPVIERPLNGCTLILGASLRVEMPALPAPAWLAALSRSAQGER